MNQIAVNDSWVESNTRNNEILMCHLIALFIRVMGSGFKHSSQSPSVPTTNETQLQKIASRKFCYF